MAFRVVQWSVGSVGRQALRALIRSSDFELVGVFTHDESRRGRDAGELAGLGLETGIRATSDAEALLALCPDCVVFTSVGEIRPREAVAELARILRSGANVVSSSMMNLVYPPAADQRPVEKLSAACAEGGATLFTSGIDPGFSGDALPLAALQICERVETVRVQELSDYGSHDDGAWATPYGFGKPAGAPAPILEPGVPTLFWGGMVVMLADVLEVELEGLEEFCQRWYAPEAFEVPIGRIEKGSLAAVRFGVAGVVDSAPRLFAEHVTRMRHDTAPDWPQPPAGASSVHRVEIEGLPSMRLDLTLTGERGHGHANQGVLATAMRLVNAIPAVVGAGAGLVTPLDLTLGRDRHLLARGGSAEAG
jgi:4-hydroxy-tetrahydrodipicolinate reductase